MASSIFSAARKLTDLSFSGITTATRHEPTSNKSSTSNKYVPTGVPTKRQRSFDERDIHQATSHKIRKLHVAEASGSSPLTTTSKALDAMEQDKITKEMTPEDANLGLKVMTAGGASAEGIALMEALKSIADDKRISVKIGYFFRAMTAEHQENAHYIKSWVDGRIVSSALKVCSFVGADKLLLNSFKETILPRLKLSDKGNDPLERVFLTGLKGLEINDVKQCLNIAKTIKLDKSVAFDEPLLEKLVDVLKLQQQQLHLEAAMQVESASVSEILPLDVKGLRCEKLNDFEKETVKKADGIFAIKGSGTLPNGEKQPASLISIREGNRFGLLLMIALGKDEETNPIGDLTPLMITTNSSAMDEFLFTLEAYGVIDIKTLFITRITEETT